MGTASFSVGRLSRGADTSALATEVITSGNHTTTGSATNVEDGSGDIDLAIGHIFQIHVDTASRVNFGGAAASAIVGHYIPADSQREFECTAAGPASIIEV